MSRRPANAELLAALARVLSRRRLRWYVELALDRSDLVMLFERLRAGK